MKLSVILLSMLALLAMGQGAKAALNVTFGNTPSIDGMISPGEYSDAGQTSFETSGGTCIVYFKHDGTMLYVAFDLPNLLGAAQVFLDTQYDDGGSPRTDDYRLSIRRSPDQIIENRGTGAMWGAPYEPIGWDGAHQDVGSHWHAEFAIQLSLPKTPSALPALNLR